MPRTLHLTGRKPGVENGSRYGTTESRPGMNSPPRSCKACISPSRLALDAALLAGKSLRSVAKDFGLTHMIIYRHQQRCLARQAALVVRSNEQANTESLAAGMFRIEADLERLQRRAEKSGYILTAIAALREQARLLDLRLKAHELARREALLAMSGYENDPDFQQFLRDEADEFSEWKRWKNEQSTRTISGAQVET